MQSAGIADTAFFGPEAEFFIFDDVKFDVSMNGAMFKVDPLKVLTILAAILKKVTWGIARELVAIFLCHQLTQAKIFVLK